MPRPTKNLQQLARAHTSAAVKTLIGIMNQPKSPAASRIQAANSLLDRGWGKAPITTAGEDGEGPLIVQILKLTDVDSDT